MSIFRAPKCAATSWLGTPVREDKSENESKAQYDFDRNNTKQVHTVGLNRNGRNMKYSMESLNTLNGKTIQEAIVLRLPLKNTYKR